MTHNAPRKFDINFRGASYYIFMNYVCYSIMTFSMGCSLSLSNGCA